MLLPAEAAFRLVPAAVAAAAGNARPSRKACVCRKSIVARAKELTAVEWPPTPNQVAVVLVVVVITIA
jgi:hypothetical protein